VIADSRVRAHEARIDDFTNKNDKNGPLHGSARAGAPLAKQQALARSAPSAFI
jgi:hypothetical protein